MTILARTLHPSTHYIHQTNLSIRPALLSLAHQITAAMPLSYFTVDPAGIFRPGPGCFVTLSVAALSGGHCRVLGRDGPLLSDGSGVNGWRAVRFPSADRGCSPSG